MDPNYINYIQPPSLKSTSIVLIVTKLLALPDVKIELQLLLNTPKHCVGKFCKVEEKIIEKLTLIVPKLVHSEIIDYVKPMGLQLLRCFDESEEEYYSLYNQSEPDGSLVWSANGTIDKIRTLRSVILDESREKNYIFLFKLACKYCYEEYMLELWGKIPTECRKRIYREGLEGDYLIYYWIITLKQISPFHFENIFEIGDLLSTRELVILSIFEGNILALKYFSCGEREHFTRTRHFRHFIQGWSPKRTRHQGPNEYADILFVLLSSLKYKNEQKQYFKKNSTLVLKSLFLHWPWQKYFLPTINVMWDYLDENLYVGIMSTIAAEAKDRNLSEILLIETWRSSPRHFRKCLFRYSWNKPNIMKKILQPEEIATVIQSLHDIFDEEGMTIDNYKILLHLVDYCNSEYFDKYMHQCITSDEKLNELKSQFVKEKFPQLLEKFKKQDYHKKFIEFKKFIECVCCTGNENFKENCYEHVMEAVKGGYYKFATIILTSCNPNVADVVQLKNEMVLSISVVGTFIQLIQHFHSFNVSSENAHWYKMKSIVNWLAPFSKTTVNELKSKLNSCFCETLWSDKLVASEYMEAFYLLDTYVNDDFLDYDNYISDDDCALYLQKKM